MCGALFDVEPCPFDAEPVNFDATLGAGAGSCFDSDSDYVIKVIIIRSKSLLKNNCIAKNISIPVRKLIHFLSSIFVRWKKFCKLKPVAGAAPN